MATLLTLPDRPKGVIDPATARKMFRLDRYLPSAALQPFLDHYWIVEWDLRGRPSHVQRTLPYPCVHLVFEPGRSAVFGIPTGPFEYEVKDMGRVLGVRFRPGAFRAFLGRAVHSVTDQVLALSSVFPWDARQAEQTVLGAEGDAGMIAAAQALLCASLPAADPQVERIGRILALAEANTGLTSVKDLAAASHLGVRTLQQLFSEYVGVSPKWVIRRYRLHEAADRLASGEQLDLSSLALALGYFDQAHFSSDFQKFVGKAPAAYRRQSSTPRNTVEGFLKPEGL